MASFKTIKNWELEGIHRVFADSDERIYPFVETILFGNHFIIDFLQQIEGDEVEGMEEFSRRFFISGTLDALEFIYNARQQGLEHTGVALLQGDNLNDGDYMSSLIEDINLYHDEVGQNAFVLMLKNGMRVVDSLLTDEAKISLVSNLYKNKAITNEGIKFLKGRYST